MLHHAAVQLQSITISKPMFCVGKGLDKCKQCPDVKITSSLCIHGRLDETNGTLALLTAY